MGKTSEIKITTEYITLGQFLKFVSLIDEGWQAKFYLQETEVLVDGEPEARRGRKLRGGEIVEAEGKRFKVVR